jgi:hypothetical protein
MTVTFNTAFICLYCELHINSPLMFSKDDNAKFCTCACVNARLGDVLRAISTPLMDVRNLTVYHILSDEVLASFISTTVG